jgi:hypothetical protein
MYGVPPSLVRVARRTVLVPGCNTVLEVRGTAPYRVIVVVVIIRGEEQRIIEDLGPGRIESVEAAVMGWWLEVRSNFYKPCPVR